MKPDGKCIWEYCDKECKCSDCHKCPNYRKEKHKKES